jgi:type IX secretion system PorP/SprF family membrane protein
MRTPIFNCKIEHLAFRFLLFAFCFLLSASSASAQQSFTYNQYMNNLTPYNTAYSLLSDENTINLQGRKQWVGVDGAPTSFLVNGKLAFENIKTSAGFVLMQDKFSIENQTQASFFYAKSVHLAKTSFLALSVNAGFQGYKANYSQLDPSDPQFHDDIQESTGTIGTSIMFYNPDKFYIGFSSPNFNIRTKAFSGNPYRLRNTYYLSAGYLQEFGDKIKFKPVALLSYDPDIPILGDISTTIYIGTVGLGINYRTSKEVAGVLSCLFNNFRVGYSYQAGISNRTIGNLVYATHELTFGLRFGKVINKVQL